MNTRRIISLVTALLLLCCIVPFAAMAADSSATITFDDLAKRTSVSDDQQVWEQNGITVTNDRAESNNPINAQYYNPIRLYKGTSVTVEYPGMTQIVFNCNTTNYANTLVATPISGATATANDKVVTLTLSAAADSFTIAMSEGQVRVDSIEVVTAAGGSNPGGSTPSGDPAADSELTIAEALALGASKDHNTYTDGKYYVTGVITDVYNTMYGNMYITDGNGNTLTIYGTYDADGTNRYDAMADAPTAGDTVTIYGIVGQYNGTAQIKNGWITDVVKGEAPENNDPEADSTLTIEEALTLGASKNHNVYTQGKYYVTGTITEVYNTTYGNMYITDDAGNVLTVYGTYDADGTNRYDAMAEAPIAGDVVTIYGVIGQYNGTPQLKNGWITAVNPEPAVGTETNPIFVNAAGTYAVEGDEVWYAVNSMLAGYVVVVTGDDASIVVNGDVINAVDGVATAVLNGNGPVIPVVVNNGVDMIILPAPTEISAAGDYEVTVGAGAEVEYAINSMLAGAILTVEGENAYIVVGTTVINAVDGVASVVLEGEGATIAIKIGNSGEASEEYALNIAYAPESITAAGEYTANVAAGAEVQYAINSMLAGAVLTVEGEGAYIVMGDTTIAAVDGVASVVLSGEGAVISVAIGNAGDAAAAYDMTIAYAPESITAVGEYTVTVGAGAEVEYVVNSKLDGAVVTVTGEGAYLVVDGQKVEGNTVTLKAEGATISLVVGNSGDAAAEYTFSVELPASNPETGDFGMIAAAVTMAISAIGGVAVVAKKKEF